MSPTLGLFLIAAVFLIVAAVIAIYTASRNDFSYDSRNRTRRSHWHDGFWFALAMATTIAAIITWVHW